MSDGAALGESYFLSYSRTDETIALRFANDLRAAGIAMWVDQIDIRPSEHWDRAIERAVRECRGLVVILSPRSAASDNVADEISFAIDHGKSVLPVMIERCALPLRITRMQVVDATGDYDRALQQCLQVLGGAEPAQRRIEAAAAAPVAISDPQAIAAAKAQLTEMIGPIAGILVDKAAARASSIGELYGLLAQRVESEKDRERLIKLAGTPMSPERPPKAAPNKPAPADLERLAALLTPYLGPMASVIARRESAAAASADDLRQRLAARIPDPRERADFLRQVQKG